MQPPIVNNGKIRNSTDNRHGIVGYLDDVELAKRVRSEAVGVTGHPPSPRVLRPDSD